MKPEAILRMMSTLEEKRHDLQVFQDSAIEVIRRIIEGQPECLPGKNVLEILEAVFVRLQSESVQNKVALIDRNGAPFSIPMNTPLTTG